MQELDRGPDIDGRNDGFLNAKPGELDPLYDVEFSGSRSGVARRVAAISKDDGGKVKSCNGEQDEVENIAKQLLVSDDRIQPGVEHKRLSSHYRDLARGAHGDVH